LVDTRDVCEYEIEMRDENMVTRVVTYLDVGEERSCGGECGHELRRSIAALKHLSEVVRDDGAAEDLKTLESVLAAVDRVDEQCHGLVELHHHARDIHSF